MSRLLAMMSAAGDRMNPIVVKEFRQAVQSRLVIGVLMLSLLVNLSIVGGYLLLTPNADTSPDVGQGVFMFLLSILQLTCMTFVPLYAGVRLSLERGDANIDLLFVTTITPGAIVRGKYITAMALTLLIYSACMPFVTFTYLLRGVDLPTIFWLLAIGFMVCAAANAAGVFAGCVPASWFMRGLMGIGFLICLLWTAGVMVAMARESVIMGMGVAFGTGATMSDWRFWAGVGSFVLLEVLAIGLLHVLSVALLSPKLSNRMLVPRLYIMAAWAVGGIVAVLWSYVETTPVPMGFWAFFSGSGLTILTVAVLGERDAWTARVCRKIPRNPLLRPLAFLVYTGSAGGIVWCALLFGTTMLGMCASVTIDEWGGSRVATGAIGGSRELQDILDMCTNMTIVYGYALCYCLTIAALRSTLLRRVPTQNLPVLAAIFGVMVWCIPLLIAFLSRNDWDRVLPWYMLGSPIVLTSPATAEARHLVAPVVTTWLAGCVMASSPWFIGQWRRFVPHQSGGARPAPAAAVVAALSPEPGAATAVD